MLERRTPLKARPRAKGNRGELAVRNLLRDYGWHSTKRNWQSGGQGGGDLIDGPSDVHWEVKWCERCSLRDWLRQCEGEARPTDIPVVAMRDNKHPWTAVLPADEWDSLSQLSAGPFMRTIVPFASRLRFWRMFDDATNAAGRMVPILEFGWSDSGTYAAVPLRVLLDCLKLREQA